MVLVLIKEYLQEGLIRNAKEEFNNYFAIRINKSLFEGYYSSEDEYEKRQYIKNKY